MTLPPQLKEGGPDPKGEEEEGEEGREGVITEKQQKQTSQEKENEDKSTQQQYHQQQKENFSEEGEKETEEGREIKRKTKKKRELETHRGFGPNAPKHELYNNRRKWGREGGENKGEEGKSVWKKLKSVAAAKRGRDSSSNSCSSSCRSAEDEAGRRERGGDLNLSFSVSANTGRIRVEYQEPEQGGRGREGGRTVCFNFSVEEFYSLMDGETLELTNTPFEVLGLCYQVLEGGRGLLVPAAASSPAVAVLVACEEFVEEWEELRGWEKMILIGEGGRESGERGRMELRLPLVKQLKDEMEKRWKVGDGIGGGGKELCYERYVDYRQEQQQQQQQLQGGIPPYIPNAQRQRQRVAMTAAIASHSQESNSNISNNFDYVNGGRASSFPSSLPPSSKSPQCSFCKTIITDPLLLRDLSLRQSLASSFPGPNPDRKFKYNGPRHLYCSYACGQEILLRAGSSSLIRRQIFALEQGVCQLCNTDCHALFLHVKRLTPPERVQYFMSLECAFKCVDKAAVLDPKEGHFWQADHVLPVIEGGGACGLDNLRTLCTPCHAKETALLRVRGREGRMEKAAEGTRDIRTFIVGDGKGGGKGK